MATRSSRRRGRGNQQRVQPLLQREKIVDNEQTKQTIIISNLEKSETGQHLIITFPWNEVLVFPIYKRWKLDMQKVPQRVIATPIKRN